MDRHVESALGPKSSVRKAAVCASPTALVRSAETMDAAAHAANAKPMRSAETRDNANASQGVRAKTAVMMDAGVSVAPVSQMTYVAMMACVLRRPVSHHA